MAFLDFFPPSRSADFKQEPFLSQQAHFLAPGPAQGHYQCICVKERAEGVRQVCTGDGTKCQPATQVVEWLLTARPQLDDVSGSVFWLVGDIS